MNETAPAWSVRRLAEAWDCGPSTIYDMINEGTLTAFGIGRRGFEDHGRGKTAMRKRKKNSSRALAFELGRPPTRKGNAAIDAGSEPPGKRK